MSLLSAFDVEGYDDPTDWGTLPVASEPTKEEVRLQTIRSYLYFRYPAGQLTLAGNTYQVGESGRLLGKSYHWEYRNNRLRLTKGNHTLWLASSYTKTEKTWFNRFCAKYNKS